MLIQNGANGLIGRWRTFWRIIAGKTPQGNKFTDGNPGAGHARMALVAPLDETVAGLTRLRDCLNT